MEGEREEEQEKEEQGAGIEEKQDREERLMNGVGMLYTLLSASEGGGVRTLRR